MNLRDVNFYSARGPVWVFLANHSHIVDRVLSLWKMREVTRNTVEAYQNWNSLAENQEGMETAFSMIEDMQAATRDQGGKFLVVIFPIFFQLRDYPFREAHRGITEELRKRGISVIDLFPAFEGKEESLFWVHPVDQHPNEAAHRIAAERIMDWMKGQGF
jgi:hypothetical protein